MFVEKGACEIVADARALAAALAKMVADPDAAAAMGDRGREIVQSNRGSLRKLMGLLEPLLSEP
jgi:3-deoxy-D-manno-octulosonic-acid transferase